MSHDEKLLKILGSFPLFAKNFLVIHDKYGVSRKFELNRAQLYVYDLLMKQLLETGRVRANILKGRQQGITTLIQGLFLYLSLTNRGKKSFILTHQSQATKAVFGMTKRFSEHLPTELFPSPDKNNQNELYYSTLESGYRVGTAGNKEIGRSMTNQYLHLSEYAFYLKVDSIIMGLMQTVADLDGTWLIKESTANGENNHFYRDWQETARGNTNYINIFVPWFWQDEYCMIDESFMPTQEEQKYLELYKEIGLTQGHLAWRRQKLQSFLGDDEQKQRKFRQEYPMSEVEAFLSAVTDTFIHPDFVRQARKNDVESDSSLVLGIDPARKGGDRTSLIRRRGRKAYGLQNYHNIDTMALAGIIRRIIDDEKPKRVCIDEIGIGAGVVDRLRELGYQQVQGVNVARRKGIPDKYTNLRAQLYDELKDWLMQEMPVQIPDSDELQVDLTSFGYSYDSSDRLRIESKDDLRARGVLSPDDADALMLTFYGGEYVSESNYVPEMISNRVASMLI